MFNTFLDNAEASIIFLGAIAVDLWLQRGNGRYSLLSYIPDLRIASKQELGSQGPNMT